jgi:hypothetical protein
VFKVFYRGYDSNAWAIGYAASASISGGSGSNTTTTSTDEPTSTTTTATDIETTTTSTAETSLTTTTTEVACPAESFYGTNSEETETLRYLRDDVLSTTPTGREIIRLYYQWSPAIVKAMEEDEEFREEVKELLNHILQLINPKGGQNEKGKRNTSIR